MATFVSVVNDMLVTEGIVSGDDDEITSFTSTQHVVSIRLAQKAAQLELAHLVADQLIPYEKTDAVLTVTSRTATLASDFVRFQDEIPWLLETDSGGTSLGTMIVEYPGGEERLRKHDLNYRENGGKPTFWYWVGGTSKTLGFWTVPSSTYYYRYYYEKDVSVTAEADTMPFVSDTEVRTFVEAAARRFKFLYASPSLRDGLFPNGLDRDPVILQARNNLAQLLRHKQPRTRYGRKYL